MSVHGRTARFTFPVNESANQDDHNGAAVWRRITDAVGQLVNQIPTAPLH